jgi:hypothetical protein
MRATSVLRDKTPKIVRPRQAMSLSVWDLGGRRRWAHPAFTRINIELTFPRNEIEENPEVL